MKKIISGLFVNLVLLAGVASAQTVMHDVAGIQFEYGASAGAVAPTSGDFKAADDLISTDDCTVGDDLVVTGLATIGETLGVTGKVTASAGVVGKIAVTNVHDTVPTAAEMTTACPSMVAGEFCFVNDNNANAIGYLVFSTNGTTRFYITSVLGS